LTLQCLILTFNHICVQLQTVQKLQTSHCL